VLQLRAALRQQEQTLERAGVRVSRDLLDEDDTRQPLDVRQAKGLFRGYYEALGEELGKVRELGGECKDIDTGLVDFPARIEGVEAFLCWQLGEEQIDYWHGIEEGFAGRKPLDP